ncbi:MAG: CxxxxCH/CxxCH domain-containing protein, partial [Nitrospirota bacterium]
MNKTYNVNASGAGIQYFSWAGAGTGANGNVTVTYSFNATESACSSVSCHPDGVSGNSTGWSTGYSCIDCHNISMHTSSVYHHVMDTSAMANRSYPALNNPVSLAAADRKCTICHADHNVFSPMLNVNSPGRAYNLRTDILTAPVAGSAPAAGNYTNTDFVNSGNGGICVSCHKNEISKDASQRTDGTTVTPQITMAGYNSSSHNYASNPTSTFTTPTSGTFTANCSKCHNADNDTKTFQNSTYKFKTHDDSLRRLLASLGMTSPSDPEEEDFCYRCHHKLGDTTPGGGPAKTTANYDYYGSLTNMTAASQDIYTVMQLGTAGTAPSSTSTTDTLYFKPTAQENPTEPMPNAHQTGDTFQGGTWIGRSMSPFMATSAYETKSQNTNASGTRYWRMVTFTSPPAAGAVSIPAGTWTLNLYAGESSLNQNAYIRYMIYKWNSGDSLGTTVVAVGSHTTELDTTAAPGALWTINMAGSAVSLAAGDKISIDIELDTRAGTTTTYTASYYFGSG